MEVKHLRASLEKLVVKTGISMRRLAAEIGIVQQTLRTFLEEKRTPTFKTRKRIEAYLQQQLEGIS